MAFTTPYQAVLLSNNTVFFGKLSGYGTSNPVLTEVYYILSKQDPTAKQVPNLLVKRGKELHAPDRMYFNANSTNFVEPFGTHSKVAQLIQVTNPQKWRWRQSWRVQARAGSSSSLAELPGVETIGMTFDVVH